jgi:D-beta-D-heptose 7-phosphate kinase/D-beta-D-heptose 1-phosphate adenosyltransferase
MISVRRSAEILDRCADVRVLVVGDLMIDRYVTGGVSRISPEAPVPVVLVSGEYSRPGGAANVALNIRALGGRASVAGAVGDDRAGRELIALLEERGVGTEGVVVRKGAQTTSKTRILADRQQVVRVDREDPPELMADVMGDLSAAIRRAAAGVSGIILEDYGQGALTQAAVDAVRGVAAAARLPVGYDPKDNHELDVAGITFATPNFMEACVCQGVPYAPLRGNPGENQKLAAVARKLKDKWQTRFMVVTLGPMGMYLLDGDDEPEVLPTRAREVFDVSGAGDTVIAVCMLGLVAGASHREAVSLANAAAGVVVGKLGTATCSREELLAFVMRETE